jgi:hypothetical protein
MAFVNIAEMLYLKNTVNYYFYLCANKTVDILSTPSSFTFNFDTLKKSLSDKKMFGIIFRINK